MVLDIGKLAYGGAFVLGGVGVGYASGKLLPEKFKPIGTIAALGLGVYGLYSVYQAFTEPVGEPATPDLIFPVQITDPEEGEIWSRILYHTVNAQVANNYNQNYKIFAGCSLIFDETGEVWDYPIQEITVPANSIKNLSWWWVHANGNGLYWCVVSVWDVFPTGDCELQGACHRLGEDTVGFEFRWIG